MLESENQYHLLKRDRFAPDEVIIKYKQSVVDGKPKS